MWEIIWVLPLGHRSVSVSRHFLLQAPHCPCFMRKWFSRDHCCNLLRCVHKYNTTMICVQHDYECLWFCGHKYYMTRLQYEATRRLWQRIDILIFFWFFVECCSVLQWTHSEIVATSYCNHIVLVTTSLVVEIAELQRCGLYLLL